MLVNKKQSLERLSVIFWAVAVFAYFFQFPFHFLSVLLVPCVIGYVLLQIPNFYLLKNKAYLFVFGLFVLFVAFSFVRSLILGNSLGRVLRFSAIIFLIPVCCLIHDSKTKIKWMFFVNFATVKALILLGFMIYLLIRGDYTDLRQWVSSHDMGDIYLLSRWNAKVQVHGNALLLVAFMLDFLRQKKFSPRNIILLGGILAAGNFAFILGLGLFLGWRAFLWARQLLKKGKISKKTVIIAIICCVLIAVPYVFSKIQQKSAVSNKTRIEQAAVLTDTNPWVGDGFGNYIKAETPTRDYDGDIYFELQTLYIYNQIGIIGLLLVYILTLWPIFQKGKPRALLYLIYLAFTFWNPYCWDTTHMITLLLLMNTKGLGVNHEKGDYYNVLSLCRGKIEYFRNLRAGR